MIFCSLKIPTDSQGRIDPKADEAIREKMGPTKVKNQEKGAYKTQYDRQ